MQRPSLLHPSLALALASFTLACSDPTQQTDAGADAGSGCDVGILGNGSANPQIELMALGPDGTAGELSDGDPIALMFPPQGGRVVFVGVRATNIDGCGVRITGALRDVDNGQVRLDARIINLEPDIVAGWGRSSPHDISTFANIAACPNQWASKDLYGNPYELTFEIRERSGRKTSKVMEVVPECAEPANVEECLCQCKQGYVLGQACTPSDGGVSEAGTP